MFVAVIAVGIADILEYGAWRRAAEGQADRDDGRPLLAVRLGVLALLLVAVLGLVLGPAPSAAPLLEHDCARFHLSLPLAQTSRAVHVVRVLGPEKKTRQKMILIFIHLACVFLSGHMTLFLNISLYSSKTSQTF